jgi:hypothetical protein
MNRIESNRIDLSINQSINQSILITYSVCLSARDLFGGGCHACCRFFRPNGSNNDEFYPRRRLLSHSAFVLITSHDRINPSSITNHDTTLRNQSRAEKRLSSTMDTSDQNDVLVGYLHLLWSLYLPTEQGGDEALSLDDMKVELLEWIRDKFLCGRHFSSFAVELVNSMKMESDCRSTGSDRIGFPPAILWNIPAATGSFQSLSGANLTYSTWNTTFPVYVWGDTKDLQEQLQGSLDDLIKNDKLEAPWEDGILAVVGQEEQYFLQSDDYTYHSIDPKTSTTIQLVGGVTLVVHTCFLVLIYVFQKAFAKRKRRAAQERNLLDVEELDDMLLLTKDLVRSPPPSKMLMPTPYTNNFGASQTSLTPTRSPRSQTSQISSANYPESLFPSMDNEDDVSEAGTEILLGSVASGSCPTLGIMPGNLEEEASSVLSAVSCPIHLFEFGVTTIEYDDRSHSARSAVGVSGERTTRPLLNDMNTVLGNSYSLDEDERNDILFI